MRQQLRIKVGGSYKTRNGHRVRIYAIDGGRGDKIHGAILTDGYWVVKSWSKSGIEIENEESADDLISEYEYTLEELGFNCVLPSWFNDYIAMDEDGTWKAYCEKPDLEDGYWYAPESIDIPYGSSINALQVNHEESLFKLKK